MLLSLPVLKTESCTNSKWTSVRFSASILLETFVFISYCYYFFSTSFPSSKHLKRLAKPISAFIRLLLLPLSLSLFAVAAVVCYRDGKPFQSMWCQSIVMRGCASVHASFNTIKFVLDLFSIRRLLRIRRRLIYASSSSSIHFWSKHCIHCFASSSMNRARIDSTLDVFIFWPIK